MRGWATPVANTACYESKTKLFVSSEVPIFQIFSDDSEGKSKGEISDHQRSVMDDLVRSVLSLAFLDLVSSILWFRTRSYSLPFMLCRPRSPLGLTITLCCILLAPPTSPPSPLSRALIIHLFLLLLSHCHRFCCPALPHPMILPRCSSLATQHPSGCDHHLYLYLPHCSRTSHNNETGSERGNRRLVIHV